MVYTYLHPGVEGKAVYVSSQEAEEVQDFHNIPDILLQHHNTVQYRDCFSTWCFQKSKRSLNEMSWKTT